MQKMEFIKEGKMQNLNADPTLLRPCIAYTIFDIFPIGDNKKLLYINNWWHMPHLTSIRCRFSNSLKVHNSLMMRTVYQTVMQYMKIYFYEKYCNLLFCFIRYCFFYKLYCS